MTTKQLQVKLARVSAKVKATQEALKGLRAVQGELKTQVADGKAADKAKANGKAK